MIIRGYNAADEPTVIALWNVCMPLDMIDGDNFCRKIICDENFNPDLFLIAEEANVGLLGFIYGTKCNRADELSGLQPEQAWIVAMGVHPEQRCKGIGTALLVALEAALVRQSATTIEVGPYTPNYFFPGIDQEAYRDAVAFFKIHGYSESSSCVAMNLSLHGYQTPEKVAGKRAKLEKEGYVFRPFRLRDSLPAFGFLRENFPYWLQNVRSSILACRAEKTIILACNPNGEIVGFVMRGMDGTEERFGPFGVHSSLQGTGVGGILFHALLSDMVVRRIFYTYFLWGEGRNSGIYSSWGMKTFRTYSMMGKALQV